MVILPLDHNQGRIVSQERILFVEDSRQIQLIVQAALSPSYQLVCAGSLTEADKYLDDDRGYDLILLDIVLPDGTGFELCDRIRQRSKLQSVPVIFLTGQTDLDAKLKGFSSGADDYLVKPFEPQELIARVQARLKQRRTMRSQASLFDVGGFQVDLGTQKIFRVASDGNREDLNLTPNELKLFAHLLRNPGQAFSREQLLRDLWGNDVHVTERTVNTHISSLRKKLGDRAENIRFVPAQGYIFEMKNR